MFSHFSFAFSRLLILALPIVLSYMNILMTTVAITEMYPSSSYGYETTTIKQFPHPSVFLDRLSNYTWLKPSWQYTISGIRTNNWRLYLCGVLCLRLVR